MKFHFSFEFFTRLVHSRYLYALFIFLSITLLPIVLFDSFLLGTVFYILIFLSFTHGWLSFVHVVEDYTFNYALRLLFTFFSYLILIKLLLLLL
jgi:succinate dehydrogenase hydrophobic anchor subunit